MNPDEILEEIRTLENNIDVACQRYYNADNRGGIDDAAYDKMMRRLKEMDPNNLRHTRVGAPVPNDGLCRKVHHKRLIGSLKDAMNSDDFKMWYETIAVGGGKPIGPPDPSKFQIFTPVWCTPKIDGLTMNLTYKDGVLVVAATRGDGSVGEDITANALRMNCVPRRLTSKFTGEVRGEVYLPLVVFEQVNQILPDDDKFSNPRNAASGIARRKDGWGCEYLYFWAFNLATDDNPPTTESQMSMRMKTLGFDVVPGALCNNTSEVIDLHSALGIARGTYRSMIDGMVVKINDISFQEALGVTNKRPNGCRAFKFPPEEVKTILQSVTWQVGDGGNMTPVGNIPPTMVGGVTVRTASLANWNRIQAMKIQVGDHVIVTRRGDVIPHIERVFKEGPNRLPIILPALCPECGASLSFRENVGGDESAIYACKNPHCPAIRRGRIARWIKSLDIKEIGDEVLAMLCAKVPGITRQGTIGETKPIVDKIADLYRLHGVSANSVQEHLRMEKPPGLEAFGENFLAGCTMGGKRFGIKRAVKVIGEIEKTRTMTIDQFIGSLGIEGLGKGRAEDIRLKAEHKLDLPAQWCDGHTLVELKDQLCIPGLAPRFEEELNEMREEIVELVGMLTITVPEAVKVPDNAALAGQSFCFTGFRPGQDKRDKLTSLGGEEKSGVSANLTYLVTKEADSTSSKAKKARELGVKVIGYDQFLELIGMQEAVTA